jgi:hypothetical protein
MPPQRGQPIGLCPAHADGGTGRLGRMSASGGLRGSIRSFPILIEFAGQNWKSINVRSPALHFFPPHLMNRSGPFMISAVTACLWEIGDGLEEACAERVANTIIRRHSDAHRQNLAEYRVCSCNVGISDSGTLWLLIPNPVAAFLWKIGDSV